MKPTKALTGAIRILLALVFLFSGFVKGVDPWGTAIKLDEYFQAFGLGFLSGARYLFSVLQSAGEMFLGLCLLFRLGGRLTVRIALWVMLFFTLLTGVLALWNPVTDCGCFGDAIKLTNWQTFYKNLVLLFFAGWVLWGERPRRSAWNMPHSVPGQPVSPVPWSLGFCFLLFSLGIGIYSLRHLPLIDFLSYKTGTELLPRWSASGSQGQTVLIYRNRQTGRQQEFSLQDTLWRDSLQWEFIDTRFTGPAHSDRDDRPDLTLWGDGGNRAPDLLAEPGPWFLVTFDELTPPKDRCAERYAGLLAYAREASIPVYGATPAPLPEGRNLMLGGEEIPLYNIDGTMLKTLIRAHKGLVLFQDGTLLAKWNCRDIPVLSERQRERSVLSLLAEAPGRIRLRWLLGVLGTLLVLTYAVYFIHRNKH